MIVCIREIVKSWFIIYQFWSIIFFIMIKSIFWVPYYFEKLLNPLINSIQGTTWFEVHFYSEKNYKYIIMCKNN